MPQAMAVWLTMKPDIFDHERTQGQWVSVGPAPGDEAPISEAFNQLPLPEGSASAAPCLRPERGTASPYRRSER